VSGASVLEAGTVETSIADGVGQIRFGHPKGNSLPGLLLNRLADAFAQLGRDDAARVIVLRSEGEGAFCAGASFDEFKAVRNAEDGKRFFSGFARVVLAMIRAPKFVLTRVQGKTAGGGVGLIAASDYVLALEGADLRLSELALGIGPFVVGPVIEKKIGLAAFSALAVVAEWQRAAWAERRGLYSELFDSSAALDERLRQLSAKLAGYHPEAMRRLKETIWEGTEHWADLLDRRAAISGALVLSDYTRKAIER
jgi:enoyl-CoA hydratase/carnithine racemase